MNLRNDLVADDRLCNHVAYFVEKLTGNLFLASTMGVMAWFKMEDDDGLNCHFSACTSMLYNKDLQQVDDLEFFSLVEEFTQLSAERNWMEPFEKKNSLWDVTCAVKSALISELRPFVLTSHHKVSTSSTVADELPF